jgi:hypothetical protein
MNERTLLDVWAGDTVWIKGRKHFRMPDGRLMPEISGGGAQGWQELIDTIVVDGTAISNSTTETIIAPDFNLPAYYMAPGRVLQVSAFGVNSNVVTNPGTLTFRVRWGGVAGTVLLATGALGLDTAAHTNALWMLTATIVCRTAGATGTFMSGGIVHIYGLLAGTAFPVTNLLPQLMGSAGTPGSSGNAAVTVDTTTAKLLSLTAQFTLGTNPTNLTCQQRLVEVLN